MTPKYTILSFIIGKDYELLHEIQNKQDDVEYVLVTDDQELKSSTWKVVYDQNLLKLQPGFERCFDVRYNVFRYCSTDICVTIDGSVGVVGSLDPLVEKFISENYDISLMPHPLWSDFVSEYQMWIKARNYPVENANRFIKFLNDSRYDASYKGLFQLCFSIKRRNATTSAIDQMTWSILKYLSIDQPKFERLDQTVFSYVMNRYFNHLKVLPVSEQVVRSKALTWFWHHSTNKNENWFMTPGQADYKFVFNKPELCYQLI